MDNDEYANPKMQYSKITFNVSHPLSRKDSGSSKWFRLSTTPSTRHPNNLESPTPLPSLSSKTIGRREGSSRKKTRRKQLKRNPPVSCSPMKKTKP